MGKIIKEVWKIFTKTGNIIKEVWNSFTETGKNIDDEMCGRALKKWERT